MPAFATPPRDEPGPVIPPTGMGQITYSREPSAPRPSERDAEIWDLLRRVVDDSERGAEFFETRTVVDVRQHLADVDLAEQALEYLAGRIGALRDSIRQAHAAHTEAVEADAKREHVRRAARRGDDVPEYAEGDEDAPSPRRRSW